MAEGIDAEQRPVGPRAHRDRTAAVEERRLELVLALQLRQRINAIVARVRHADDDFGGAGGELDLAIFHPLARGQVADIRVEDREPALLGEMKDDVAAAAADRDGPHPARQQDRLRHGRIDRSWR